MRRSLCVLALIVIVLSAQAAASSLPAASSHAEARPPHPSTREVAAARKAEAEAEAAKLLSSTPLPPGASAAAGEPAGAQGRLAAASTPDAPFLVGDTGWWIVPGTPSAAISYVSGHVAGVTSPPYPVTLQSGAYFKMVQLPEGTGPISERRLVLRAVALSGESTALRVDSQVLWVRPRDLIPDRVKLIYVTLRERRESAARTFAVRSRRRVAATLALVNSLPPVRPSLQIRSCPAPFAEVVLAFFAAGKPGPAPLALVTATIGGCGGVGLAIRGDPPEPPLEGPTNGLIAGLEHALGRKHLLRRL